MTYIDSNIKSVELLTIKRGSHKVLINWVSGDVSSISFSNKKDAEYYIKWLSNDPTHPIHKSNTIMNSLHKAAVEYQIFPDLPF